MPPFSTLYQFTKDLLHVRRVFPGRGVSSGYAFSTIETALRLMADTFGTSRLGAGSFQYLQATGANVQTVELAAVPAGSVRYVLGAHINHDDGAATKQLWFTQRITIAGVTRVLSLKQAVAVIADQPLGLERYLVLPEGCQLQGRASAAVGAGINLTIEAYVVDVPTGEYVVLP